LREFITITLNGVTYFVAAAGFSLIFGLMRVVNLAHGSLDLLGAYIGWSIGDATGSWYLALITAPLGVAVVGVLLQQAFLRRIQGQELREALVTIGVSIIIFDMPKGGLDRYCSPVFVEALQRPLYEVYCPLRCAVFCSHSSALLSALLSTIQGKEAGQRAFQLMTKDSSTRMNRKRVIEHKFLALAKAEPTGV
jgi:branched-subunit amino acid ABC-type transport system permease component